MMIGKSAVFLALVAVLLAGESAEMGSGPKNSDGALRGVAACYRPIALDCSFLGRLCVCLRRCGRAVCHPGPGHQGQPERLARTILQKCAYYMLPKPC